ncbi:NAD(P)-binding protein [Cutaneotrichosporon oleaginosum]|uniref:NAD(P)-binding protein n=1 Tax=Cutaneotrichosporon oleaginosum TaxID=879819 RepID=A0A0J0XEV0_9TREE|nr:NAD(P)-binding protein [Cutaneotrichosporon oleaginosum]KLT39591.1 NAD(P)-binding protein [Cutaneotrichosporon oleaginosum]TXT15481.1 hypothetical protein COLE_01674 [Cutaneotrichosporon oleaginosum]
MPPIKVLIFGVTGQQGGSVAKYLLEDGPEKFKLSGLTRNTSSKHAQALAAQGVEMIQGDLDDPASYDAALKNADAVFLNTNWWQWYDGTNPDECTQKEGKQAMDVVDVCHKYGNKQLVYSSLESFDINGQKVPHTESKTYIREHIEKVGLPTVYVNATYYMSNVLGYPTEEKADGTIVLKCPLPDQSTIPQVPIEQLGLWVRLALRDWNAWKGKTIDCVTDKLSVKRITEVLSEVTGKKFDTMHVTLEWFESDEARAPNPEMHLNSYVFVKDLIDPPIKQSRGLVEGSWDFGEWCLHAGGVEKKWSLKK